MFWAVTVATDELGAVATEYALIAVLIAVGMLTGLFALEGGVTALWTGTAQQLQGVL